MIACNLSKEGELIENESKDEPLDPLAILHTLATWAKDSYTLGLLSRSTDDTTLYFVSQNTATPPEALARLARSEDRDVRFNALENPNTPSELLTAVARSGTSDDQLSVALNPNAPVEALEILKDHPDPHIQYFATHRDNY